MSGLLLALAVSLASPFGDGMVLQRERPVPVWGWAEPGTKVAVSFAGQTHEAVADGEGAWRVTLEPMKACAEPRTLCVEPGALKVSDVLVGEVWLASGQSNMAFRFANINPRTKERNGALLAQFVNRPTIRYASVARVDSDEVRRTNSVVWSAFSPKFLKHGAPSAVATYFALHLNSALDVPVGIVGCPWGGTNIDAWIPHDGESAKNALSPRRPCCRPAAIFRGTVAPLAPFAVRGVIWYQGEADCREPEKYAERMRMLCDGWERAFENEGWPFLFVQIAPYRYDSKRRLVPLQIAQAEFAASRSNAYMTVVNDIGNIHDIHPNEKGTVGLRLAALALGRVYGFGDVEADAPVATSAVAADGGHVEVSFAFGKGLYVYNDDRSLDAGFELAGEDGVFRAAEITNISKDGVIEGDRVVLSAKGVPEPRRVRFLFREPWYGALRNRSGIPAGPFELEVKKGRE